MANEEAWVLDGLALNDGTTLGLLSMQAPPPRQRQDWIGAADSETQLLFRNPLHDNRKITARVVVLPQATMDLAHDKILLVVDKLQKASRSLDGIAMTWTAATGTRTVTFDVLAGEITDLPIDWESGWLSKSPEFTIELTCKPYWRGTETLTSTASSSTPFVTLEIANVTGDVPALGRIIITDTASQSRRHVEWGLEGPLTYNNATSLLLDSDSLVTSGFAGAQATGTGAYDPNATGTNAISCTLYAATGAVAICGTGNQSHIGTFRVKARVQTGNPGDQMRLSWRANDGPMTSNSWVSIPGAVATWQEIDLGLISVPVALVGSQRWTGQVEGKGSLAAGAVAWVDYLVLVPVSDGYGKARAAYSPTAGVVVGADSFSATTAGNALTARTAPLGGAWATSGDTTDFLFGDSFTGTDAVECLLRSSSAAETSGRFAIVGSTNYTDMQVDVRSRIGTFGTAKHGPIARWVDSSNHLRMTVPSAGATNEGVKLEMLVAGTPTTLAQSNWTRTQGVIYRFRLIVFVSGRVIGQVLSDASQVLTQLEATSSTLATGGTLDDGKPGLYDRSVAALGEIRRFTEFSVSTPPAEPIALYSGRNMQIRYDDVIRQDSTGTYTGRPQSYRGSRFLVPVGTSRVLVKARRNDIETVADDQVTDATQVQVGWTARGLAVPR